MIHLEIGRRTYPLRFTARSLLRTRERGGQDISLLLRGGEEATALLLYGALCDALPHLTLAQAQSMLSLFSTKEKLDHLLDALARAYDASGFPPEGLTQEGFDRLLDAAADAGMAHTHCLYDLTYTEIVRELNAHLAHYRIRRHAAPAAATDEDMQKLIIAMTGRDTNADH